MRVLVTVRAPSENVTGDQVELRRPLTFLLLEVGPKKNNKFPKNGLIERVSTL